MNNGEEFRCVIKLKNFPGDKKLYENLRLRLWSSLNILPQPLFESHLLYLKAKGTGETTTVQFTNSRQKRLKWQSVEVRRLINFNCPQFSIGSNDRQNSFHYSFIKT